MLKLPFYIAFLFLMLSANGLFAQLGDCLSGDCKDGFGHFEWKTGEEYVGNFANGKMNGYGVFYWQNKRKYIGNWEAGKMNGEGLLFYDNGQIRKGIWKANAFLRLSRGQYIMSKEKIDHATSELNKMLEDRPNMAQIVEKNDLIWTWVTQKFAGDDVKSILYWQANSSKNFPIPTGVDAVHAYPTAKTDGRIWVKNSDQPENMWAGLIYELHNIKNGKDFQAIEQDAKHWRCSKEEYIRRYAALEYKAARETLEFYKNIWLPYCQNKNIQPTAQLWFYYLPDSFEEWMASFTDKNGYPWHPYSGYYDSLVKDVVNKY